MKKKMVISVVWLFLAAVLVCMPVHASEKDAAGIVEQIKQQLSEAFDSMDEDTAVEVFAFLKSQVSEGNLASDEGVEKAITEGEKKFGVELFRGIRSGESGITLRGVWRGICRSC